MARRSIAAFAARELKEFGAMQYRMNLYLRSMEVAMAFSRQSLDGVSETFAINEIWKIGRAPKGVLEQYTYKDKGGAMRPYTVGEFKAHLTDAQEYVFRSVIVFYLAAFERFLKRWTTLALELLPDAEGLGGIDSPTKGTRPDPAHRDKLRKRAYAPQQSVRVGDLAQVFEKAVAALRAKQPVSKPSSSAKRFFTKHDWDCMEATEMWRHVRNAIVHHDGALDKIGTDDSDRYREMWVAMSRHAPRELPATDPIIEDRVSLQGYHVVYCFTNTRETVNVLVDHLEDLEAELRRRP